MSCVRESSPPLEHVANQRPEPKRRRFNPMKGLRRIFRRKTPSAEPNELKSSDDALDPPNLDASKSRSTNQLIDEPFPCRRLSFKSNVPNLSLSHDSVFNPEQNSGQSDSESAVSVPRLGFTLANIQSELRKKIAQRKIKNDDDSDVDEDDLGLPRSPSMHSPTIATGNDLLLSKELITKSSHSTCSDGSLISMGSSEMDEDSFGPHNSRYSSKISLHDKRSSLTHLDSSDGDSSTSFPLSHSAAKHRIAVRPRRNHANPRSKKPLTVANALPTTPEVNEEHSGRSVSPDAKPQTATADGTVTETTTACTSCDLDTCVDEISVENVPTKREEGFFHRLLSRRSTKKKTKSEDAVDTFLFDETITARRRQREEPPPAGRMQLSYPPDLPADPIAPTTPPPRTPLAEGILETDTFAPIKEPFSLGQATAETTDEEQEEGEEEIEMVTEIETEVEVETEMETEARVGEMEEKAAETTEVKSDTETKETAAIVTANDRASDGWVQKSSSTDSVSSNALDETTPERCRSYSSSDSSEHRVPPVPAPRPSKIPGAADVVTRRKKRDDQPELLKVFARRSLKLGEDGEPELSVGGGGSGSDKENECSRGRRLEEGVTVDEDDVPTIVVKKMVVVEAKVDVNENQTTAVTTPVTEFPRYKRIQQRREEWEKRLQQN